MKKLMKSIFALVSVVSLFAFASCADAIVDDGTHVRSYVSSKGGAGGAVPFHMFQGCDLQIWVEEASKKPTFSAVSTDSELEITVLDTANWFGGAFVNKGSVGPSDSGVVTFDMSAVAKMSCEAKASREDKFSVGTSDPNAGYRRHAVLSVTTEYDKYEWSVLEQFEKGSDGKETGSGKMQTCAPTAKDYGVFVFSGDGGTLGSNSGATVSIKNIAFYDAAGNEIVPTLNK